MEASHHDKKGELEVMKDGRCRLYRSTLGYLTKTGGYSTNSKKAETFKGPGEATRRAALLGFAVTRISLLALLLVVAGCNRPMFPARSGPGGNVQFQTVLPGPVTWSADGGTITPTGNWTAPACGTATFPATYNIKATSPIGTQTFTVSIEEAVLGISIVGALVSGETVVRPGPTIMLRPGQTAQFFARTTFTCHSEYSPSKPPGF